jgi:hypothetical protein
MGSSPLVSTIKALLKQCFLFFADDSFHMPFVHKLLTISLFDSAICAMSKPKAEGGEWMKFRGVLKDFGLCILSALPVFLYAMFFLWIS